MSIYSDVVVPTGVLLIFCLYYTYEIDLHRKNYHEAKRVFKRKRWYDLGLPFGFASGTAISVSISLLFLFWRHLSFIDQSVFVLLLLGYKIVVIKASAVYNLLAVNKSELAYPNFNKFIPVLWFIPVVFIVRILHIVYID